MEQADLPSRGAQLAVEPVLGDQLACLVELPALDERVEQQHERAAGEGVDAVVDELERQAGVVLGLGDLPAAQREVGRVPGGTGAQPQRSARRGLVAHRGDRLPRLFGAIGHDQRPHAQVVGRAPAGLAQQQIALERLARQPGARGRVGRAELDPDPGAMGEEDAREQRVRRRGQFDRGGAPRALDVAPGNHHQGVERRGLDRQPCAGVALAGQLALEELGVIGVAAAERVERRQAREQVDTALAIAHLGQRVEQPALRVGQARVEGDGGELREHPPAVVAGRVLLQRALEVRGRGVRRPAARRGGRGVDQQPAHLGVGLRAALEQVAGDDVGVGAAGHQRARGVAVHALARGSR